MKKQFFTDSRGQEHSSIAEAVEATLADALDPADDQEADDA